MHSRSRRFFSPPAIPAKRPRPRRSRSPSPRSSNTPRHRASSSTARWPGSTMWHRRQTPCAMPPTASPRTTGFRSAAGEAASWRPSRNPCPTRADTTSTSKATSSTRRPNRASCGCRRTPTGTERPTIRGTNCGAANTTTPKRSAATRSPIPAPRRRTPR